MKCGVTRKKMFRTHDAAMLAACRVLGKADCNVVGFRAYACDYCGGWHLTKKLDYWRKQK